MRALFTQLSIFIGLLTAIELYGRQPNLPIALLLGLSAACTIYIVLLLGDYAVHQYFEDRPETHASLTYLDASYDPSPKGRTEEWMNDDGAYEKPDSIAA